MGKFIQKRENKSSAPLPADPDSMYQGNTVVSFPVNCIWVNCLQGIIPEMDPEYYGWNIVSDDEIHQTCFTGNQFPSSLRKVYKNRKINRSRSQNIECIDDVFDGDISCESFFCVFKHVLKSGKQKSRRNNC